MSACRSRALSLAIGVVLLAVTGPLAAQVGPPVRLVPRPQSQPAPAPTAPSPGDAPASPAEAPAAKRDADAVQIGQLNAADPSGVGLLDESNGGFSTALWRDTPRGTIATLLPKLGPSTSPALQSLARRLLLSGATVPVATEEGPSLLALRIAALDRAGDVRDAAALAQAAPSQFADPTFIRAAVDAAWLAGQPKIGCGRSNAVEAGGRDEAWRKANAFCRAFAGEHEAASLSAELLREQNAGDPAFFALLATINGEGDIKLESLPDPSPLALAMLRATNKPVPADVLKGANPATSAAVAAMSNAPSAIRVPAAERAAAFGGVSLDQLAKVYEAQSFTAADLASAPSAAKANRDGLGNALLYQAVKAERVPAAEAEALAAAFALNRATKSAPTPLWLMRLYDPFLSTVTPGPGVGWFAGDATRAYLALGNLAAAKSWTALADVDRILGASGSGQAPAPLGRLLALADKDAPPVTAAMLAAWYAEAEAADGTEREARAALFYTLLEALGQPVPAEAWQRLEHGAVATGGTVPSILVRHGLAAAASSARTGETVLYTLLCFGEDGPAGADPTVLAEVIIALRKIGLEADARAIAVEAALGRGL
jgi:hypothetical protein